MKKRSDFSLRWFLLTCAIIAVIVAISFFLHYTNTTMFKAVRITDEAANGVKTASFIAMDTAAEEMMQLAAVTAELPTVQSLLLEAAMSVESEKDIRRIRKQLQIYIDPVWERTPKGLHAQFLTFYTVNDLRVLLRAEYPEQPAQAGKVNEIVLAAADTLQPTRGYAVDAGYAGMRGAVPVVIHGSEGKDAVLLGIVEVGGTMQSVIDYLTRAGGQSKGEEGGFAVLLRKDGADKIALRDPAVSEKIFSLCGADYIVDAVHGDEIDAVGQTDEFKSLLKNNADFSSEVDAIGNDSSCSLEDLTHALLGEVKVQTESKDGLKRPKVNVRDVDDGMMVELNGELYGVMALPIAHGISDEIFDFKEPGAPLGVLIAWAPFPEVQTMFAEDFREQAAHSLLAYIGIVVAVFFSWRIAGRKLRRLVDERTKELAQANEELHNAEQRYRGMYENAVQGMFRSDFSGTFHEVNPAFTSIFGYDSPEEFVENVGTSHELYIDPQDRENILEMLRKEGILINYELKMKHRDGSTIWILYNAKLIGNPVGPHYIEGIVIDNTAKRMAEKELRREEEKYKRIIETTGEGFMLFDKDWLIRDVNPSMCKILGYDKEEILGRNPIAFMEQDSVNYLEKHGLRLEAQEYRNTQLILQRKDGISVPMLVNSNTLRNDKGEIIGHVGFFMDVTEQKKYADNLKKSEEKYRRIVETAAEGFLLMNNEYRIIDVNQSLCRTLGYTREEALGRDPLDFVDETTREYLLARREEKIEDNSNLEAAVRSKDGTEIPVLINSNALRDDKGEMMGIVGFVADLSEQKKAEALQIEVERKKSEQRMLQADKMAALGRIIAGVAHEINNPNNFIYFNLPVLRDYLEEIRSVLEERMEEISDMKFMNMPFDDFMNDVFQLLKDMEHGSERITGIVAELKNYIRSHEEESRKPEELETVINRVMALVGKQVGKMVKRFDVDLADNLPKVDMHAGRIEQVLINLVINAGQAADKEDSGITLRVFPGENSRVILQVEDNGKGIPEDILEKIFDPFFTTKGPDTGTGLGLSISRRIIEEHEGIISVESVPGEGAKFSIELPVHKEQ